MSRRSEWGTAMIEGVIGLPILVFLIIGGYDLLNLIRYSSGAYSIALTAARVASVENPNDTSTTVPQAKQLKIPVNAPNDYLRSYAYDHCGNPNALDAHQLKTINLALGWASELFMNQSVKTASNWFGAGQSSNIPKPGEMIIVPEKCNADSMDWKVCINVPQILTGAKYVCKVASSEKWVHS